MQIVDGRQADCNVFNDKTTSLSKHEISYHSEVLTTAEDEQMIDNMHRTLESDVCVQMRDDFITNDNVQCCRPAEGGEPQRGVPRPTSQVSDVMQNLPKMGQVGECKLRTYLNVTKWKTFQAGRVSQCLAKWHTLTTDPKILADVRGHKIEFASEPYQNRPARELRFSNKERSFLKKEIETLLKKGVITRVRHEEGEYISNIFLREKRDSEKHRMILNLKQLNKHAEKRHFKMDTLLSALALVTPGCYFLSFDFSDAYYSIAVHSEYRKFLRFEFEGVLYEFSCVPNGITSGPRLFTKLLKVPLSVLREKHGVTITGYLDDQLLFGKSVDQIMQHGAIAADLFQDLGFMISIEKSVIEPVRSIKYLGFIIDSESMSVKMTSRKVQKISTLIQEMLSKDRFTIRFLARVVGKLVATGPANHYAQLYTKQLDVEKQDALQENKFDYDGIMSISEKARADLRWWLRNLSTISAPIYRGNADYILYTDASRNGWGCYDPQTKKSFGGRWTQDEQEMHINALEMMAIKFGLESICRSFSNCHIQVMTDNVTAMVTIRKQGSLQSIVCNKIARQIWEFVIERELWLTTGFCPGVENSSADKASREFNDQTEWSLDQQIFDSVCEWLQIKPNIDLFASRINYKIKPYASWQPDPEAKWVDSFLYDWSQHTVYVFPPFAILPTVIQLLYNCL